MSEEQLTAIQAKVLDFIQQYQGEHSTSPSYREIAKYMNYKAVGSVQDVVRVLQQKGFLTKSPKTKTKIRASRQLKLAWQSEKFSIPILGRVPAGPPREAIESAEGSLSVPGGLGSSEDLFALQVHGDSMINAGILSGDYVIVRTATSLSRGIKSGDLVVASIDGEATVKRYQINAKTGERLLIAENPKYGPIKLQGHSVDLVGMVVGVQRYLGKSKL